MTEPPLMSDAQQQAWDEMRQAEVEATNAQRAFKLARNHFEDVSRKDARRREHPMLYLVR